MEFDRFYDILDNLLDVILLDWHDVMASIRLNGLKIKIESFIYYFSLNISKNKLPRK